MNINTNSIFARIVKNQTIRYASIFANGICLPLTKTRLESVKVHVISYGEARTYYVNKKPECRSFNGVNSYREKEKKCSECEKNEVCTPQVYLDCSMNIQSMRLLLSYTSACNFLTFAQLASLKGKEIKGSTIKISIINRGTWGEAVFELVE